MRKLLLLLIPILAFASADRTLEGTKINTYSGIISIPLSTTDTLVTRTTTDTLTNKSIDGTTNTLTNLPAAAIVPNQVTVTFGTSPYTTLASDKYILCDATGGSVTITLTGSQKTQYHIVKTDVSANPCILDPSGADTIIGVSSYSLTVQYQTASPYKGGASSWVNF